MLSSTHHPDTLTFKHISPPIHPHTLSYTIQIQPHLTYTSSRYTHSRPQYAHIHSLIQLNLNTYTPSRYTYILLLLDTFMLPHPYHTQKHLHTLLHTHTVQLPPLKSLSSRIPTLHTHHADTPILSHTHHTHISPTYTPYTIHRYFQLYTYSHTPPPSLTCPQILFYTHTHTHTSSRYISSHTSITYIHLCTHPPTHHPDIPTLEPPHPNTSYPYSFIHSLYSEIPTISLIHTTQIHPHCEIHHPDNSPLSLAPS